MKFFFTVIFLMATLTALTMPSALAQVASNSDIEEILILGLRDERTSKGATGLDLTALDTPQNFYSLTAEDMQFFSSNSINDALDLVPGLLVERWETNRTNYTSRGLEIKSTQVDGVGMPNNWGIVTGDVDTYGYEKIEVIRGANGLLTGVGNASGTINYVRKRPTNDPQGEVGIKTGSYGKTRLQGDFSAPVTEDGRWASRWVVAQESADSHLRALENDRAYVYGVVDGQIGDSGALAVGYSLQQANTTGNLWGALVFANSDGTQAEFDVEASTTQDWTYWDTLNQDAFVEYQHALNDSWDIKAAYNARFFEGDSQLFYVYSSTGLDPQTGAGLIGWPGAWGSEYEAHFADVSVTGQWDAFGDTHQIHAGVSYAVNKNESFQRPVSADEPAFGALPPFPYAGDAIPEPNWGGRQLQTVTEQIITRQYAAIQWALIPRMNVITGVSSVGYEREKIEAPEVETQTENEVSPYVGVTIDVIEDLAVYASYSDIYQPQDFYDRTYDFLAPSKGVNAEVGVKAQWFEGALLATLAAFDSEQKGLGVFEGINEEGRSYYRGQDVKSSGYEFELAGQVNEYLNLSLSGAKLDLVDFNDEDTYTWVPRKTLNFSAKFILPFEERVTLGVSGRWQSEIYNHDRSNGVKVVQDSYALLNFIAQWKVTDAVSLQANLNNVTDEKYITSLHSSGYYAAPTNGTVSLDYQF